MTWAMATLAHKDEEYLRRLVLRALEQVDQFNPQECSNLAWAFALLTFRDDELLAALSRRSQEIVMDFIPQNLGNTAWAYNRLGFRDEGLMQTIVRETAQRLNECQGQEVLDVIESIATGNYIEVVDQTYWAALMEWTGRKFDVAKQFLDENAHLPLTLPALSDFDRALAVQDYRDQMAKFDIIGLGYTWTERLLQHLGVRIPEGDELEEWRSSAQVAALDARHEGDQTKNQEAQEGLKACRTVCVYRFSISREGFQVAALRQEPKPLMSGPANDSFELGLFSTTLKHPRGGDGEFQALQACARACAELGCQPASDAHARGETMRGEVWLHVSEVPCLSCVGAMAQFRQLFPHIALNVAFTLGRQPAGMPEAKPKFEPSARDDASSPGSYVRREPEGKTNFVPRSRVEPSNGMGHGHGMMPQQLNGHPTAVSQRADPGDMVREPSSTLVHDHGPSSHVEPSLNVFAGRNGMTSLQFGGHQAAVAHRACPEDSLSEGRSMPSYEHDAVPAPYNGQAVGSAQCLPTQGFTSRGQECGPADAAYNPRQVGTQQGSGAQGFAGLAPEQTFGHSIGSKGKDFEFFSPAQHEHFGAPRSAADTGNPGVAQWQVQPSASQQHIDENDDMEVADVQWQFQQTAQNPGKKQQSFY
eukprot:CAMPEP_0204113934 /NCGR_PEP_ID=MMETSP0361-20130328/3944_1 /ASSEMBLY_ACC=CAM_ASM_000343 /TAXON_ID=268821 /ORGANISM="Scrippsiella Hangoei, Strain SHTV-5" /LENGTH=645 /DNA_ID=CAMNT_0051064375 /DNA_START=8 /DNA_END=1945 /DNA_ORIENTATION=-